MYMKVFAQEGLGRPDVEIAGEVTSVQDFLKKRMSEDRIPPIQAALVFTNEKTVIDIGEDANPPAATLSLAKLKDFVRKTAKGKPVSLEKVLDVQQALSNEA